MSFTTAQNMITAAFVQQFHDSYVIKSQQTDSRFQSAVEDRGSITGESFTINDLGSIEMTRVTTRFADTVWDLPDSGTRSALMADYNVAIPVEKRDLPKLLADPQGKYLQLSLAASNRTKDNVIYRALLDTVLRREANESLSGTYTPVALPATQTIIDGGTGMTKAKLIAARAMFRRNECDEKNGEQLYIAYNADMLTQILGDTTLTSADYMAGKMLQEGNLSAAWLGFNWIPYEKMDVDTTSGAVTAVAWCKSAVHFGTGMSYQIDIGPRRDKNNTIQISADVSYGAGRAAENKVVAINFIP